MNAAKTRRRSPVTSLGEVALRVNNLPRMKRFYQEVLGLEVLGEFPRAVLLKVAENHDAHTQVLGLFDRSVPVGPERTTIDHVAFSIALKDYEPEMARLEALGLSVERQVHAWIKWRSLYFHDPEGNEIELVCFDPGVAGSR
jgi:catechol-2,3-dioxygenase